MTDRRPSGVLTGGAALVSVVLWASTFTVFSLAFRRVDPLAFVGARYLLLVPIAVLWLGAGRRRGDAVPTRGDRRAAAIAGVFGYFLLEVPFVLGLARTTAVASAILIATHPIWGVTASAIGNRRRPSGREIAGLAIGMAGVVVFLGAAGGLGAIRVGDLLSLVGAMAFGVYGAIAERLGPRVPERQLVPRSMLSGGVLIVLVAIPALGRQDWSALLPGDWLAIVYSALGPILLGYWLWAWALKRRGMARTAPFGYLEPIFAASLAVAVLGDTVTAPQLAGAGLVLVGVVLAASGEVREHPPDATEDIAATIRP